MTTTPESLAKFCTNDLPMAGAARADLPPTTLFNEGWMLRLVLEYFSHATPSGHALDLLPRAETVGGRVQAFGHYCAG